MNSPVDRATKDLGYSRTASNLTHSRMFVRFALESLPGSAPPLARDLITDAYDALDMALDCIEEGQPK